MMRQIGKRAVAPRQLWIFVLLTLLIWVIQPGTVHAADQSPSQRAETLRTTLFQLQMALPTDPVAAESALQQADELLAAPWFAVMTAQAPTAAQAVEEAMAASHAATAAGDGRALAAARMQLWTALLDGAQQIALQAVAQNDTATAHDWLLVREFRQATRFSRPNADGTLALLALQAGAVTPAQAVETIRADLLDTYQARLNEALHAVIEADQQDFLLRRAEHAAAAQGYFTILAPAYLAQRGEAAATTLTNNFADLTAATLVAADNTAMIQTDLSAITGALDGFRAAPLLPTEQVQRAGQLLRFLNLVGVEYGRGVRNGAVTSDLEIREAVTFLSGARAAFDDLRDLLAAQDAEQTAALVARFAELDAQVNSAVTRSNVAAPAAVDTTVAALDELLRATMPAAWLRRDNSADFDVISTALDNMEAAVAGGDYELAESARVDAYAIFGEWARGTHSSLCRPI
ncbi:MAG: hypothetical protein R2932_50785 [Caldilineaceae bacterium]